MIINDNFLFEEELNIFNKKIDKVFEVKDFIQQKEEDKVYDIKDYKWLDLSKIMLDPFYSLLWLIDVRYKKLYGSKDNGKSKAAALRVATKFMEDSRRNCVVMRKYVSYNFDSTFKDILWAFAFIAKEYNIPQLNPIEAEDYRRGRKKGRIVYYKTNPGRIEDVATKTQILFTGLDRIASGGFTPSFAPGTAVDTLWVEEPIDITEEKVEIADDTSQQKWRVIESTLLRGYRDEDEDGKEIIRKGFEWVKPEIIETGNAHDPENWRIKELDSYVPLNISDRDDVLKMIKEKYRAYLDFNYQGGDGIFIARTSLMLNPGRDRKLAQQMFEDDFDSFAYLYGGGTRLIGGLAYEGFLQRLDTSPINLIDVWPISIGIDYAISSKYGDYFAAEFLGSPILTEGVNQYPSFRKKVYFHEWGHNNKINNKTKDDVDLAQDVLNELKKLIMEEPNIAFRIAESGFTIMVPDDAISFANVMSNVIQDNINEATEGDVHWLKKISVFIVQGRNAKVFIEEEGGRVNARKGRVLKNRSYMSYEMIHMPNNRVPKLLYQTQMTAFDKKGEVVDRNRDFVDAGDYAWMEPFIDSQFDKVRDRKRRITRK